MILNWLDITPLLLIAARNNMLLDISHNIILYVCIQDDLKKVTTFEK